jgi:alkylated DNA repair dioxygenase AlkB
MSQKINLNHKIKPVIAKQKTQIETQSDIDIIDGYFKVFRNAVPKDIQESFFHTCQSRFPEQRSVCKIFGKQFTIPRDQFFTTSKPDEWSYKYSNHTIPGRDWTDMDQKLCSIAMELSATVLPYLKCEYSGAIVNRYKNGNDGVGWHADVGSNENQEYPIVSMSFGATRYFDVRFKNEKKKKKRFELHSGDVIVMMPGTQAMFEHQVPKQKNVKDSRINVTFRVYKK